MILSIVYWNTAGSKAPTAVALEDREEHDVIAIQEPWINPQLRTTYCPSGGRYHRVYGSGRAALYVHKRHAVTAWEQRTGQDWCSVTFGRGDTAVTVWSIYSPIRTNQQWASPIHQLRAIEPQGRNILVGDFNLHHPFWDKEGRESRGVGDLLLLAEQWRLYLATPWGEPTRTKRGDRDSTIDLAWATEGTRVEFLGDLGYAGSDHHAQLVKYYDDGPRPSRSKAKG